MDTSQDLRAFLMSRRAKISPHAVGLPAGGRRRVAGLRREEVAILAGVSVEYYVQIERGHVRGVSEEVLRAIAAALRLDEIETAHLFNLARAATARTPRGHRGRGHTPVPPGILRLLDTMSGVPAIVQNGRLDILAANTLGRALYAPVLAMGEPANIARFIFLDDAASDLFPRWDKAADDAVGLLRVEAARSPHAAAVTRLVGELSTYSEDFRRRWAEHDVRAHRRGTKDFRHSLVGDLTLDFEALQVTGIDELTLIAYTAEPASPSQQALGLLASWVTGDDATSGTSTATAHNITDPTT